MADPVSDVGEVLLYQAAWYCGFDVFLDCCWALAFQPPPRTHARPSICVQMDTLIEAHLIKHAAQLVSDYVFCPGAIIARQRAKLARLRHPMAKKGKTVFMRELLAQFIEHDDKWS